MLKQGGKCHDFEGVHPLIIARHEIIGARRKPDNASLIWLVAGVLIFLSIFAYGLRVVDQHYGTAYQANEYAPNEEFKGQFEFLSRGMRFLFGVRTAQAAEFDAARYKAEPLQRTVRIKATPGEVVPVELFFRNLGSETWSPEGTGFVSVYTTKPRYHAGRLTHSSWLSSSQPARLASASVKSGEVGIVKFSVQAPSVPGRYSDWMQLAAEDTSWVWGGHVEVVLTVNAKTSVSTPQPYTKPVPVSATPGLVRDTAQSAGAPKATLLLKSASEITAPANTAVNFTAGFKNIGDAAWMEREMKFSGFTIASVTDASLRHASWPSNDTAVRVTGLTEPGRIGFLTFTLQTPKKRGTYRVRLNLAANGTIIPDAFIDIPVTVTNDYIEPYVYRPSAQSVPSIQSVGGTEPDIRIGLYYSEIAREEFAANVPYEVRSSGGALLASFQAGASVQAWYDPSGNVYRITNGIINISSPDVLRFVPMNTNGIFTLLSHTDRPSWNTSLNDNRFRGVIEMRRHSSGRVWIINELPMEQYLWGLAETSNNSPTEFMKSLAVAARSYGNWHLRNPGKYDDFTVGALNDQVYKGYGAELRYPKFKSAVQATQGQVVTYNGNEVITPYYSWSDGRTRAWTEVWGGSAKPWLVSVIAQYDVGKTLFGHGVGMSAWDAIGRANAGWGYDRILGYYYTDTSLRKLYD